jgi:hypothetical protein
MTAEESAWFLGGGLRAGRSCRSISLSRRDSPSGIGCSVAATTVRWKLWSVELGVVGDLQIESVAASYRNQVDAAVQRDSNNSIMRLRGCRFPPP